MLPVLKVISDFYDFMLYLVQRIEKFPRHHRYSLGVAMENRMQVLLALLLRAKYTHEKSLPLREANIELEVRRFQLRLASDLKAILPQSYGHASKLLLEVGAQVGGWLKSRGAQP